MIDPVVKAHIQEEGERFIALLDRYKDKLPNSLYVGLRGTMQVYIEPGGMQRAERIDEGTGTCKGAGDVEAGEVIRDQGGCGGG